METVIETLPYIIGMYEILSRVIPTQKNWSVVHNVFKVLTVVSTFLNRKKQLPKKSLYMVMFILVSVALTQCKTVEKIDCYSKSTFPLTYVTPKGAVYSVNVPYCVTIKLKTETPPDTLTLKKSMEALIEKN